ETMFGVVVGYSLVEASQHLAVGWFGVDLHEARCSVGRVAQALYGGNPVDSADLSIIQQSTRPGLLINATTKMLLGQPGPLCRPGTGQRPFASPSTSAVGR